MAEKFERVTARSFAASRSLEIFLIRHPHVFNVSIARDSGKTSRQTWSRRRSGVRKASCGAAAVCLILLSGFTGKRKTNSTKGKGEYNDTGDRYVKTHFALLILRVMTTAKHTALPTIQPAICAGWNRPTTRQPTLVLSSQPAIKFTASSFYFSVRFIHSSHVFNVSIARDSGKTRRQTWSRRRSGAWTRA